MRLTDRGYTVLWRLHWLLVIAGAVLFASGLGSEVRTRAYLRGFADAVVPARIAPLQKVEHLMTWFTQSTYVPQTVANGQTRDPRRILNDERLLSICSTAANAFVNVMTAGGVPARRLLLMQPNGEVRHVVAEVKLDGIWVVVDPMYRLIMRGPDGHFLTKAELADPQTLRLATASVPEYGSMYSYNRTAYIRFEKLPGGAWFRSVLNRIIPDFGARIPVGILLIFNRTPQILLAVATLLMAVAAVFRALLALYARNLGITRNRLRERIGRAVAVMGTVE